MFDLKTDYSYITGYQNMSFYFDSPSYNATQEKFYSFRLSSAQTAKTVGSGVAANYVALHNRAKNNAKFTDIDLLKTNVESWKSLSIESLVSNVAFASIEMANDILSPSAKYITGVGAAIGSAYVSIVAKRFVDASTVQNAEWLFVSEHAMPISIAETIGKAAGFYGRFEFDRSVVTPLLDVAHQEDFDYSTISGALKGGYAVYATDTFTGIITSKVANAFASSPLQYKVSEDSSMFQWMYNSFSKSFVSGFVDPLIFHMIYNYVPTGKDGNFYVAAAFNAASIATKLAVNCMGRTFPQDLSNPHLKCAEMVLSKEVISATTYAAASLVANFIVKPSISLFSYLFNNHENEICHLENTELDIPNSTSYTELTEINIINGTTCPVSEEFYITSI